MNRYHFDEHPHSIVFGMSLDDLYDNHRTNFDGINVGSGRTRHTALDWFLIPKSRPSIDKATLKEHYIEVPGMNGGLDLSESLTGSPLYNYIEGEFEFTIRNEKHYPILNEYGEVEKYKDISWELLNRDIRDFLNGKKRYMMLEDDPSWYYVGRFNVEKYDSSDGNYSGITIGYKVYPFKKLSTHIHDEQNPLNVFFDSISLSKDDNAELMISFWNKTDVVLYPDETKTYNGNKRGELPCGSEAASVSFRVSKESNALHLYSTLRKNGETITREVETVAGEETVKVRNMVLLNKTAKGTLYSDCVLTLEVKLPDLFDSNKSYKKGDCITKVFGQPNIKWILKAKEDITAGSFDITKWEVDDAMVVPEFSEETPYSKGKKVYVISNGVITLCEALEEISGGVFNPSQWKIAFDTVSNRELYNPLVVSLIYDIGVM